MSNLEVRQSTIIRYFSILPLACYVVLIGYACYSWSQTGHWPYYAHPDPQELPHGWLLPLTSIVLLVGLISLVVIPAGYVVGRAIAAGKGRSMSLHRHTVMLYLAGATLWVLDLAAEFTAAPWSSTISWLLD